jgi:DNA repair photolyase
MACGNVFNTTPLTIHGRGAAANPANRFEQIDVLADPEAIDPDDPAPAVPTVYLRDTTRKIIATNDSPDVGFEASINPYRGCEHGCIYCFARPTHEYLGFSAGLDFETKIMVKENAPQLLARELSNPRWQPKVLQLSGVTDCYQPIERKLLLTRRCLQVLAEFRNPVTILTKNHLVSRDVDVMKDLAPHDAIAVAVSITTLDPKLTRIMEPRASSPARRLDAITRLRQAGIPVGVMFAPVVPGINEHEAAAVMHAAADAGASFAGYTVLRLPYALAGLFEDWLTRHFPDRKEKVLNRIRSIRGGKLNQSQFGQRMRGEGIWSEQIKTMVNLARKKAGLDKPFPGVSIAAIRRPATPSPQLTLW